MHGFRSLASGRNQTCFLVAVGHHQLRRSSMSRLGSTITAFPPGFPFGAVLISGNSLHHVEINVQLDYPRSLYLYKQETLFTRSTLTCCCNVSICRNERMGPWRRICHFCSCANRWRRTNRSVDGAHVSPAWRFVVQGTHICLGRGLISCVQFDL
jgi:hypothetical protein